MKIKSFRQIALLPPEKGNPRNSEGAFIELDDKRIAFAYSKYNGDSFHDHANCDICVIYSTDGGESFDTEHTETLVQACEYGEQNVMSVSFLRMQNGDIGLFFLLKHKGLTSEYILRRYDGMLQEKKCDVRCITGAFPAYYVVNNDRVIRHSDGRLIIPAAMHDSSVFQDKAETLSMLARTVFFVSYDDGYNWEMQPVRLVLNEPYSRTGLQEPGLVELPNGSLYCYLRTDCMRQYEAISPDGRLWTAVQPSRFTSPDSPMLIKRDKISGRYFAVWNPIPNYQTRRHPEHWIGGRTPLVIADSQDGLNFSEPVVLEDDPMRGFCYPSMCFTGERTMLLAYCSGGSEDGMCLNRISIKKLEWE